MLGKRSRKTLCYLDEVVADFGPADLLAGAAFGFTDFEDLVLENRLVQSGQLRWSLTCPLPT